MRTYAIKIDIPGGAIDLVGDSGTRRFDDFLSLSSYLEEEIADGKIESRYHAIARADAAEETLRKIKSILK
jgi:hypothetical protein